MTSAVHHSPVAASLIKSRRSSMVRSKCDNISPMALSRRSRLRCLSIAACSASAARRLTFSSCCARHSTYSVFVLPVQPNAPGRPGSETGMRVYCTCGRLAFSYSYLQNHPWFGDHSSCTFRASVVT